MRRLVVMLFVIALVTPVFGARPADDWPGPRNRIVKIVKKMIVKVFGDFITIPRP